MTVNRTLLGFFWKEMTQLRRDPRLFQLLFIMPLVQLTLFGYALSTEIRNIRLAVFAAPTDVAAKSLERRCYDSGWFGPAGNRDPDPFEAVNSGRADAAFVAPPMGLERALARGEGRGKAQLLIDATNSTRAQSVEAYFNSELDAEIRSHRPAAAPQAGLDMAVRMLFNPSMQSSYFMVPGILGMLLVAVTMMTTSSALTREKELGTFETLIAAPVERWEIIVGKCLPFVLLGLVDLPIVLCFARVLFGVPLRSPYWWWQLPVGSVVFISSTVGVGLLVSTVARNQMQAMMASMFVVFPMQMFSGLMYPLDNMPAAIAWLSYLNPLRYFIIILRSVTLKGGDTTVFWMNLWPMALIGTVMVLGSFRAFRQKLN